MTMIQFAYQLASTAAHLIAYAARVVAEETGIIADPWEWAIVNLMGQKRLYGQIKRSDASVEVMAFDPDDNDMPAQSFHGWGAIYSIEIRDEQSVRRGYVESIGGRLKACGNWSPSSVFPELCRTCAHDQESHFAAMAQAERVSRYESLIREVVGDAQAYVRMHDEEGDRYDGADGNIKYVRVMTGGKDRILTEQEWNIARKLGVKLGPYGSRDPDDDIPF